MHPWYVYTIVYTEYILVQVYKFKVKIIPAGYIPWLAATSHSTFRLQCLHIRSFVIKIKINELREIFLKLTMVSILVWILDLFQRFRDSLVLHSKLYAFVTIGVTLT